MFSAFCAISSITCLSYLLIVIVPRTVDEIKKQYSIKLDCFYMSIWCAISFSVYLWMSENYIDLIHFW